jgi:hypothetical protein
MTRAKKRMNRKLGITAVKRPFRASDRSGHEANGKEVYGKGFLEKTPFSLALPESPATFPEALQFSSQAVL